MRQPIYKTEIFKQRRSALLKKLGTSALIISSQPEAIRNGSVHHPFRQDSDLFYLTGFEEPQSVLVLSPTHQNQVVLFVREKDITKETWEGFRFGPELTSVHFEIDKVYPLSELSKVLPLLLMTSDRLYYRFCKDPVIDESIFSALDKVRLGKGRSGQGYLPIYDSHQFIGESRVIKSDFEIQIQRQASELSAHAHKEVMKYVNSSRNEREIHGYFIYQIMKQGAAREGYGSIVAGGANACTLHYVFNDQPLKAGELLLIDAGGEYQYQTADITRTYPVSGVWTAPQLKVYEGVLKIQKELIKLIKPGLLWSELQEKASYWLAELMLELDLLSGRPEDIIHSGEFRKYYPHGVGHYLGLDVHDAGLYINPETKLSRPLEPGMVLTIEPGLYIPGDDSSYLRGIGVRIEDNILVTPSGCENLTESCPKNPADLEKVIGHL